MAKAGRPPCVDPERVREAAANGTRSVIEIGVELGISTQSAMTACRRYGIEYRRRKLGQGASLTDEQRARIVKMFYAGYPYSAIIAAVGSNESTIHRWLRDQGHHRQYATGAGATLSAEKRAEMRRLINEKRSVAAVAKAVGLSRESIYAARKEMRQSSRGIRLFVDPWEQMQEKWERYVYGA